MQIRARAPVCSIGLAMLDLAAAAIPRARVTSVDPTSGGDDEGKGGGREVEPAEVETAFAAAAQYERRRGSGAHPSHPPGEWRLDGYKEAWNKDTKWMEVLNVMHLMCVMQVLYA